MPTLTDKIIRHQVYLEGLKAGMLTQANPLLVGMEQDIRASLIGINSEGLGVLSKAALLRLIKTLRASILKRYSVYTYNLLKFLQEFMVVEIGQMRSIFEDEETADPEEIGNTKRSVFAIPPNVKEEDDDKLIALWWPRFKTSILPANGIALETFVQALGPAASIAATQMLLRAAANRSSLDDTLAAINAMRGRMEGQTRAVLATALQSVSAQSQAAFAKILGIDEYEWLSVLDNRTSDICRSRSGKRYLYGKGPLPPAHPNCRSMIVPVVAGEAIRNPSFKDWSEGLPTNVREDMFSGPVGEKFEGARAISLKSYKGKSKFVMQD